MDSGRPYWYGLVVGLAVFLPLHLMLDASAGLAIILVLVAALAAGLAVRKTRGDDVIQNSADRARFGAAVGAIALGAAILPPGYLLRGTDSPAIEAPQSQVVGVCRNADSVLDTLMDDASVTTASEVAYISVDKFAVVLRTYDNATGLATSYMRFCDDNQLSVSASEVDERYVSTFALSEVSSLDLVGLFDEQLAALELQPSMSDSIEIAAPGDGQPAVLSLNYGVQGQWPTRVQTDADGVVGPDFAPNDTGAVREQVTRILADLGVGADTDALSQLVMQWAPERHDDAAVAPVISTPLQHNPGIYFEALLPDGRTARVWLVPRWQPVIQYSETPSGAVVELFSANEIVDPESAHIMVDTLGKDHTASDSDMATASMRQGTVTAGGTMQLGVEVNMAAHPGSHATFTLDRQRIN